MINSSDFIQPQKLCATDQEAKAAAAESALIQLGVIADPNAQYALSSQVCILHLCANHLFLSTDVNHNVLKIIFT